jgi:tellurite resistance protein TehA-like permease
MTAGPPKQFAVAVGVLFSAAGTAAVWGASESSDALRIGGAVVWATLAFFAALEGFMNFCAGCWVFGRAIQWGVLPASMYAIAVAKTGEMAWQWDENMGRHDADASAAAAVAPAKQGWAAGEGMLTDATVRVGKDDAWRRRDWNPVKHVRFGYFNSVLSITGLAQLWRLSAAGVGVGSAYELRTPDAVWQVLIVVSAALWVALTVLMIAKAVMYPRRLYKDFWHPSDSSQASFPFIVLCVFANTTASIPAAECPGCSTLSHVLLWAGAGPMLLLAFVRVADVIATPTDEDSLNPSWLVAPVGLFVAANAGPRVDPAYREVMTFFYAFAFMWYVVTFLLMMSRRLRLPSVECRMHPQYYGFVAAPAVAASAFVALQPAVNAPDMSFFAKVMLWVALGMYAVLTVTFARSRAFLGACCFSMMEWGIGFPTVKLAQTLMEYHARTGAAASYGLMWAMFAAANVTIFVLAGHTVTAMLRGGVWRSVGTWMPLQAVLYVDEAIGTGFLPHFKKALDAATPSDLHGAARLAQAWLSAEPTVARHLAVHKNEVLFPAINEVAGGAADSFIGLNARSHDRMGRIHAAVQTLLDAASDDARGAALASLRTAATPFLDQLPAQLRQEREALYPIVEKLLPVAVHKSLVKRMWDGAAWSALVPWVVKHLPSKDRRGRLLRALQWCMPERTQLVGQYLARGVDAVMWADLTRDMPALIPRGMPGWRHYL